MAAAAAYTTWAPELSTAATHESMITELTSRAVDGCGLGRGGSRSPALDRPG